MHKFDYPHIKVGTVLYNKYKINKKIKKGRFSRVFAATYEGRDYALKVYRNGAQFRKYFDNEIKILTTLQESECPYLIKYIDEFIYLYHDEQFKSFLFPCIVFNLYSENLGQFLERLNDGLNIATTSIIVKQILLALCELHKHNIIHTDLSIYNILINGKFNNNARPQDIKIIVGDLGSSTFEGKYFKKYIGTIETNSPEALLELKYTKATDIWSLGCIVFEMITGEPLFNLENGESEDEEFLGGNDEDFLWSDEEADEYSSGDESDPTWLVEFQHLQQMEELLGKCPKELTKYAPQYFNGRGNLLQNPKISPKNIFERLEETNVSQSDAKICGDFINNCLKYLPNSRMNVENLLKQELCMIKI